MNSDNDTVAQGTPKTGSAMGEQEVSIRLASPVSTAPTSPGYITESTAPPNPPTVVANTLNDGSTLNEATDSASSSSSPIPMQPFASKAVKNCEERADKGHPDRKRRASSDSFDSSLTKVSEGNNEDNEEEDNDDDDEKLSPGENMDPERLKAFNMFVRLFVDENLDRMVPISKQPKEKIQAILEACDRQFPEFRERSRKRIRTYLKSCRRLKKKDSNGQEIQIKQTPPHLTSAAAENILAQACENESHNAKRMRMGLEPLPASLMTQTVSSVTPTSALPVTSQKCDREHTPSPSRDIPTPRSLPRHSSPLATEKKHAVATDYSQSAKTPSMFRTPHDLTSQALTNGSALFRPGFPQAYTPPAHAYSSLLQSSSLLASQIQNGPTDLSMKNKPSGGMGYTPSGASFRPHQPLSASEIITIKQLIAGYRESAAFLYRSADELEQILSQQHNQ